MINISIFDYQTSVISRLRKGTPDDPYINITESQQIIQNKAVISEIPDTFTKVTVSGLGVTWIETNSIPTENQYKVDYNYGYVEFHSSRNNETLNFSYKGTGAYYLNAKRVFVLTDTNGEVIETLQDVVDVANEAMVDYVNEQERISNETGRVSAENIRISNETTRGTNETDRVTTEDIRVSAENIRISNESARVSAENIRISNGALIKSGDTMNGILNMNNTLTMNENEIDLGGFKIKHNPNLNSLDIEF